jgi:hypothetical protein
VWKLQAGGCLPNHPELKTDLCTPTYSFNVAGKLVPEAKDDIKKRGLRSTAVADALCLTFAEPVQPKWRRQRPISYSAVSGSYGPFRDLHNLGREPWSDCYHYDPFAEMFSMD